MAHFAQLDENNIVLRVIVIRNQDMLDENGNESEEVGVNLCKQLYGEWTNWKQTSYNGNFRFMYAGVGAIYDPVLDAFYPPKPFPSWVLDDKIKGWSAPIEEPNDGQPYYWDEESLSWKLG